MASQHRGEGRKVLFETRPEKLRLFPLDAQIWPEFGCISSRMSFAETYSHEVIETRRIRAQRARFWAKLISLLLMITVAAVLRSEPQLRTALMSAAVDGVTALRGTDTPTPGTPVPTAQSPGTAMADPEAVLGLLRKMQPGKVPGTIDPAGQSQSGPVFGTSVPVEPSAQSEVPSAGAGIKINRPSGHSGPRFQRAAPRATAEPEPPTSSPTVDINAIANQIGKVLGGT